MKKTGLLLLALAAVVLAQDFGDFPAAKKKFKSAFRSDREWKERLDGVEAVAFFDTEDAAKLLVSGFRPVQAIIDPLRERLEKIRKQLEGYRSRTMLDPDWKPTAEVARAIRELHREADGIQGKIDGEHQVLEAIRDGLASMRSKEVIEYLQESALRSASSGKAREVVAEVLGEIGDESTVEPLVDALRDKDARVKAAAARSLGRLRAGEALDDLLDLLSDKAWAVRAAAIAALGDIGQKGAVGPLIEQLEKEEGRLREDCARALTRLTGMQFGQSPELWKKWWEEHKHEYGEEGKPLGGHDPGQGGDPGRGYYGIPVVTNRAIFILDISGSMAMSSKDASREPTGDEKSKIEVAKAELTRTIKNFDPKGTFNIIVFNDAVKRWQDRMVPAKKSAKDSATSFVAGLAASSSTNIYDAMELAFKTAGMGTRDKYYELAADTIFLLSDGSPTKPDGSLDDWMKIIRAVREWNGLKRVTIHAIGVGGHNVQFMSMLASENGGKYVAR